MKGIFIFFTKLDISNNTGFSYEQTDLLNGANKWLWQRSIEGFCHEQSSQESLVGVVVFGHFQSHEAADVEESHDFYVDGDLSLLTCVGIFFFRYPSPMCCPKLVDA